jgi:hypothetical protein
MKKSKNSNGEVRYKSPKAMRAMKRRAQARDHALPAGEERLLIRPAMLKGAKVIWPDADLFDTVRKELRAHLGAKTRVLPQYAPDDGPSAAAQIRQIKALVPKRTTPRSIGKKK